MCGLVGCVDMGTTLVVYYSMVVNVQYIEVPVRDECQYCNPLQDGWCEYVETPNGKMLDEKCPRVAAFVDSHRKSEE